MPKIAGVQRALAHDVWKLMLECSMRQFGGASDVLQRLGLTPGHMKLLLQLEEGEGRPMGSLAQAFRCDASTMTWLVDRLEERGMVERRMLPADRRVKAVVLTKAGAKAKAEIAEHLFDPPEPLQGVDLPVLREMRDALDAVKGTLPDPAIGFVPERRAESA